MKTPDLGGDVLTERREVKGAVELARVRGVGQESLQVLDGDRGVHGQDVARGVALLGAEVRVGLTDGEAAGHGFSEGDSHSWVWHMCDLRLQREALWFDVA